MATMTMNEPPRVRDRLRRAKCMGYTWERAEKGLIARQVAESYDGGPIPLDLADLMAARLSVRPWVSHDRWRADLDALESEVVSKFGGDPLALALFDLAADRLALWCGEAERKRELDDIKAEWVEMHSRASRLRSRPISAGEYESARKRFDRRAPFRSRPDGLGRKVCGFVETKSAVADGTTSFYPATWDGPDLVGDVIRPGAFARTIPNFLKSGWIAAQHQNSSQPIGVPTAAVEDRIGLKVAFKWHSTPEAQAWRKIVDERTEMGAEVKASIGYQVVDSSPGSLDGRSVRYLNELMLFEASIVLLPANPAAGFR